MLENRQKPRFTRSTQPCQLQHLLGFDTETASTLCKDKTTRQVSKSHEDIGLKVTQITETKTGWREIKCEEIKTWNIKSLTLGKRITWDLWWVGLEFPIWWGESASWSSWWSGWWHRWGLGRWWLKWGNKKWAMIWIWNFIFMVFC